VSSATFELVGWIGIAYHDCSAIVMSPKSGPDQRPDETVGAIAPSHVPGHDGCVGSVASVAYSALHAVSMLEQLGQLPVPLDVHPQFRESAYQYRLDHGLGGEQDEGKFGRGKVQVMKTPLDTPSVDMDLQLYLGEAPFQQGIRNAKPTQYLHRSWLHRQRRRP
jgi:hypothetical protein